MNEFKIYSTILKLLEPLAPDAKARVVDAIAAEIVAARGTQVVAREKPSIAKPIDAVGVAEAAKIAGVTRQAIYMAIKRGRLKEGPGSKRGNIRIAKAEVLAAYQKHDREQALSRAREFVASMRPGGKRTYRKL